PLRRTVYAEVFRPNQPCDREHLPFAPDEYERALRDERYKLVVQRPAGGAIAVTFYDLERDPEERASLVDPKDSGEGRGPAGEARAHFLALRGELRAMGFD